jgi:tetratricopeptide (TPR) repeat protein
LDEIHEIGSLPGTVPLQIAQARARAVVLADYLGKADTAIDILDAVPDPTSPDLSFLLHYTAGCIMFDAGRYADALRCLDTAAATSGDAFSYYRLDVKRRAAIAQSKLGKWDDAKRRCINVIHLIPQAPDFLHYDRLEMMGELAWIHWVTGNKKKACGAMYGFVMGLVASEDMTESRFREAFNKAGHGLGWFLSIATTGEPPSLTQYGEPYAPVDAGIFGIRRDRLGSYIPPIGFSKAWLLTQLGMLAGALDLSRMAWKIYKVADPFVQQDEYKTMLEYGWVERASLATRFGDPDEAVKLGLQTAKALAVGKRLRENGIVDVLNQPINLEDIWETIPDKERDDAERHLLYIVFGPAFTDLLSADPSKVEWLKRLEMWEGAVSTHRKEFTNPDFWDEVVQFFRRLVTVETGQTLREEDMDIPEGKVVLKALLYLVASSQQSTRLVDSLQMQVMALDFLARYASLANHMLPGVGRFIHRFWVNIANTRGFALNSPQLFRGELLTISPEQGANTSVKVLLSASWAVGISLPKEILTRFRQVEESGMH